jgi:hypothetical protein
VLLPHCHSMRLTHQRFHSHTPGGTRRIYAVKPEPAWYLQGTQGCMHSGVLNEIAIGPHCGRFHSQVGINIDLERHFSASVLLTLPLSVSSLTSADGDRISDAYFDTIFTMINTTKLDELVPWQKRHTERGGFGIILPYFAVVSTTICTVLHLNLPAANALSASILHFEPY